MGLDSIVMYGTSAGAMSARSPTSAVIKGNQGDAYIVGYSILGGTDNNHVTLTCTGDPRWEAAGVRLLPGGADAAQAGAGTYGPIWLQTKLPIKCGATAIATQDGSDDCYCVLHVEYPMLGDQFKLRDPYQGQPTGFQVTKSFTSGAALAAFTITVNAASDATFQRGKVYTPVSLGNSGAMTTPFFIGIQNTKVNLATFWCVPLTPIVQGGSNVIDLPYGIGTVDGGETQFIHLLSTTADTPVCHIRYAYA